MSNQTSNQQFTPGPWGLRGVQIRADNGRGQHVATYQVCRADGVLLAAAPRLLEMLVNACESLDAAERASGEHCTARDIREELAVLGLRAAYDALKEADDKRYGIGRPAVETTGEHCPKSDDGQHWEEVRLLEVGEKRTCKYCGALL